MPADLRGRFNVLQWLIWQTSGFGPILGQVHHFNRKAPAGNDYAVERFATEARRLY